MFSKNVHQVQQNLRKIFPPTPLQKNMFLSRRYGANIYLKREDLSPVRSYKIRGAFNLISKVLETDTKKKASSQKFVCASAGNHAQGFAFACQYFGVHGTIFMPLTTPQQKIEKTRVFGGKNITIELIGDTFDEAYHAAKKFCKKQKALLVPPFDHPLVIEGQATVAAEILEQLEGVPPDMMILPVGGGGLSAGVSEYAKTRFPKTTLVCCEPEGAPSLSESLKVGKRVCLKKISTFVDGAAVAELGAYNFKILKKNITEPVQLVPENRLCCTMTEFLNHEGIVLEPAGALAIDALKNFKNPIFPAKRLFVSPLGGTLILNDYQRSRNAL